ncbi:hypothetical protein CRI94_12970 [Longibacter salinarum]|uniref:Ava_C0101 and related proteins n=1 Tax=Longibacter salinarum TaxID=1850348 RepID=A0A2A8CVY1_9BACT|nr:DUF5996 family protein [Longibacter salinarum]PEN12909.1 hypothetical protein CRI94_12970 [Longibacter salinarum]
MDTFPPLPYEEWISTRIGLHLRLQIIGKIRLALMPKRNHWWHVPLYVSTSGFTTRPMPCDGSRLLEIEINVLLDRVRLRTTDGEIVHVSMHDGQSISEFYREIDHALSSLGVKNPISHPSPFDAPSSIPFADDDQHDGYDGDAVRRFWRVTTQIQPIFQEFQGQFLGKDTPVHLFWHSFDLAYTRFSGREAPPMPDADPVTREAYSHEVISFGFWAGDETTPEAGFYSYTFPEPDGLTRVHIDPEAAAWVTQDTGSMAFLPYEAVRRSATAREDILTFLNSTYEAGAKLAEWPAGLVRQPVQPS